MSEATELRLEGAEIQSITITRKGKVQVQVQAKWMGQIPEEYQQVKLGTLDRLIFGADDDQVELAVSKQPTVDHSTKRTATVTAYLPGFAGEVDSRYLRLVQWMEFQTQHQEWELRPDTKRGNEPPAPAVEWTFRAPEPDLFGGGDA